MFCGIFQYTSQCKFCCIFQYTSQCKFHCTFHCIYTHHFLDNWNIDISEICNLQIWLGSGAQGTVFLANVRSKQVGNIRCIQ